MTDECCTHATLEDLIRQLEACVEDDCLMEFGLLVL